MKVLRITNNGVAEYLKIENKSNIETNSYHSINSINRNDILNMLEYLLENDFEYDSDIDKILNDADKIIFKHLLENVLEFEGNKETIIDSVDSQFVDFDKNI